MSGRSPEEREAARLERERKRAAREGRPFEEPTPAPAPAQAEPAPVAPWEPAPVPDPRAVPEQDPQATQQWDAVSDWTGEHAAAAEPPSHADAPPTEQYDVAADWMGERASIATAPSGEGPALPEQEAPLGTRRVAPHEHPRVATPARDRSRGRGKVPPAPATGRTSSGTMPGARVPRGSIRGRLFAGVALLAIVVAGWFLISLYQPFTGKGGDRVVVQIPAGSGVSEIGDVLVEKGVISSAFFFRLRASLAGDSGELKSGRFTLREGISYAAALEALKKNPPPPPVINITLPEGPSRGELAARIKDAGLAGSYVAASRRSKVLNPRRYGAPKGATLEGFLFPATYELKRGATAQQLVAEQLTAFKQNIAGVDLGYAKRKNLTPYDVLVIAAMVEREVAVARERPLVAAVIYNRLKLGIPLGIDATLRFGLGNWTSPLKVSELESNTPYNTRTHQGLPPGPIGNPGLASIKAAAHPANVDYLFYVVKPGTCGEHSFSATDAQFQQDVAKYNAARDAAGGKSPTKC